MKRIVLIISLLFGILIPIRAEKWSEAMATYLEGCRQMRQAIEKNDISLLTDAKLTFKPLTLSEFSDNDYWAVEDSDPGVVKAPIIYFTPDFAEELVKKGVITLDNVEFSHLMRKGDDNDLNLIHGTIEPNSRITYKSLSRADCEMLLFSMSDSKLELEVTDVEGKKVKCDKLDKGTAWIACWEMPDDPTNYTFTIINKGKKASPFVVAIN